MIAAADEMQESPDRSYEQELRSEIIARVEAYNSWVAVY